MNCAASKSRQRPLSPRNETVFWVGAAGAAADAGEGTDFHAVEQGWVSVTPLQIDLTHAAQMSSVRAWLDPIE